MRNAEATKERILDAAMTEFSAYGIAGARVDRIAKNAGCNKNLIYIYFENKETLFTTVLQKHLARVYDDVSFTADDLPGYAGRVFDFALANPDLMRLMTWFGLEQATIAAPEGRGATLNAKVAALAKGQEEGKISGSFPPSFLLIATMALATAWTATNPFGRSLDPVSYEHLDGLRENIIKAVSILTIPRSDLDREV